ncbi:MAG: glycosyltransferase family 2 protein [Chitinispirillaceae bacterium]|nr:glycosyltransferase family 2 protein [Chitinispirillaceae bacterium]
MNEKQPSITVILPCYNEENTIGICIDKALKTLRGNNLSGEVLVVNNCSTDQSAAIAAASGARVVNQPIRGYGAAYIKGIAEAKGDYLVMGDADNTYDFEEMPALINELERGSDMVIGSRFMGKMEKRAMSFTHRYIGNPILTTMLNLLFGTRLSDCHSGFRAIRADIVKQLELNTTGMEFASEMIAVAIRQKIKIKEIPITYYPREGESKLNPLIDAWRHVRFLLVYSPDWLYLFPGMLLFFGGIAAMLLSAQGRLVFAGHRFDIHAMVFFTFSSILGYQILNIGIFAKKYALITGFIRQDMFIDFLEKILDLERTIITGLCLFTAGMGGTAWIAVQWLRSGMGALDEIAFCLGCLLALFIGIELIFSSFFLSLLQVPRRCAR